MALKADALQMGGLPVRAADAGRVQCYFPLPSVAGTHGAGTRPSPSYPADSLGPKPAGALKLTLGRHLRT